MDNKATPKNWDKAMKNLRSKYPSLTEDDFDFEEKNREELISHLAKKLDKSRDEAKQILTSR